MSIDSSFDLYSKEKPERKTTNGAVVTNFLEPPPYRVENIKEKWDHFFRKEEDFLEIREQECVFPVSTYVQQLKDLISRHSNVHGQLERLKNTSNNSSQTTNKSAAFPPRLLYKKLQENMTSQNFRLDFIQQKGVGLLCEALKQLQYEIKIWERAEEETDIDILRSKMIDEFQCIMCIKFAARDSVSLTEEACMVIINSPNNLEIICQSLLSPYIQTRIALMDLITNIITFNPKASLRPILRQFTNLRLRYSQEDRFRFLVNSTQPEDKLSLLFKGSLLGMMNEMLMACPTGNYQVYLQTELEESGFDVAEVEKVAKNLERIDESFEDASNIVRQVALWRENYILVDKPRRRSRSVTNDSTLPTYQYGCRSSFSTNAELPAGYIPKPPVPVLPKKAHQPDIKVIMRSASPSQRSTHSTISTSVEIHPAPPSPKLVEKSSQKRSLNNVFPEIKLTSPKTSQKNADRGAKFGVPALQMQSDNLNHRMASKFSSEYNNWKRIRSGDSLDSGESSDSAESAGDYRGAVYLVDGISPAQRTLIDDVLLQFDRACDVLDAPTPEAARTFIKMV